MALKIKDKYLILLVIISAVVAVLMHFPELISLVDDDPVDLFPGMTPMDVASEMIYAFFSLVILFTLNMYVFGFNRPSTRMTWQKIISSFILTWMVSSLLGNGLVFIHRIGDIPAVDALIHYYLHPLRDFIITLIVVGSSYIFYLIRNSQQVQLENQELRAENLLNQYEALKNQLNPHMLFNSLNTLRSLIREAPGKAQDYLQELSSVLRYTLQENENKSVTLKEEMEFVEAYLFLLKMRYEENLVFNIRIDKKMEECSIPPMSVQMLIENAVKHNEISNRKPLTIEVMAEEGKLTVINKIQPKRSPYVGTGIGLANLNKRYQLLFRKEITVQKEKNLFSVTIPLM